MKRFLDFISSLLTLVLLSPIILAIIATNIFYIGRPVFFIQKRPGLGAVPFNLVKFRTMKDDVDQNGVLLTDCERLSSYGRFLRSTSLDELPSFYNVLKGEMSLVGPRPLLMEYLPLYTTEQARRHDVRPGITGWAQVNGRNAISWEDKFIADIWYVNNQSIFLDFKILLLTVIKVLRKDGISANGQATMPKFTGKSS